MEQDPNKVTDGGKEPTGTKTVSFDELLTTNREYQSEFDKKVAKATETAVNNALEKYKLEQDETKSEAEKLAKMNAEQLANYKIKKAQEEADSLRKELSAVALKDTAQKLAVSDEYNLDVTLLDFIDFKNTKAEEIDTKLKDIKSTFDKAVERRINEKFKEPTPRTVLGQDGKPKERPSRASY